MTTLAGALSLLTATSALAASLPTPPDILKAERVAFMPVVRNAPVLDGVVQEAEWPAAGRQGDFVTASSLWEWAAKPTSVRLCRDTQNVYVALDCEDDAIDKLSRREDRNVWGNDVVEILLQSPRGAREKWWHHIAADPVGHVWFAREEAIPEMPGTYKSDEQKHHIVCAVKVGKDRWTIEMAIPLADLQAGDDAWGGDWRGNFCRETKTPYAFSCWNMTQAFQDPTRFGRLVLTDGALATKNAAAYMDALSQYQRDRQQAVEAMKSQKPVYPFAYAFNFGPADKCAQQGYKQVDAACAYTAEKGYGWTGETKGLVAQAVEDLGEDRAKRAKPAGSLASSWVTAAEPDTAGHVVHRFRVDVPAGDYKVHLLCGLLARESFPHRRMFTVYCNDRKLADLDIGHYMFARPFLRCRAENGGLEFRFEGPSSIEPDPVTRDLDPDGMKKNYVPGWLVNALVIYPAQDRRAAERQIALDEMSLLYLPSEDLMRIEEVEHPVEKDVAEFTAEEKQRGFVVFERLVGRLIYPGSRPQRAEIRDGLRLRVTPGEPAYFSFALLPLRDLDTVTVAATDLRGPGGQVPAADIRVREAQYRPWRIYGRPQYAVEPVFLDEFQFLDSDMNAGECRWFWLSFRTPETLAAGNYEGGVTLAAGGGSWQLKLTVDVMPFRAAAVPFRYGGYYPGGYGKPWPIYADRWARAFADVGMSTLGLYYSAYRESDLNFLKNQIRLLMKNGVNGPFTVYSYISGDGCLDQDLMKGKTRALPDEVVQKQIEVARMFLKWSREEGLPELIYTAMDEAHCKGEPYWGEQVRLISAVKKAVPQILTAATESDRSYWRLKEHLDVPLLFEVQDFRSWRLSPDEVRTGREIWSYPNQALLGPTDINAGRFCTGWLPALTGLRGIIPWQIYEAADFNESWLKNSCWFQFVPRPVGGYRVEPRLVTVMGHIGIWDLRYVETLRSLIAEAERGGSDEARTVATEMKDMLQRIDETTKGSYMYYFEVGYWKPEAFVTLRERVTDGILQLSKALGQSTAQTK